MGWTVAGQDAAVNALARAIEGGRVSHAYLFAGAAHTGKTLTALQFAQALNCLDEAQRPCGRCRACERIAAATHPDIEIVGLGGQCDDEDHAHVAADSRDIRVCQVRRISRVISRAPFEGRWRVVVIEPADAMNDVAQNALLKTLEEPPPNVALILIAEQEDRLLETIRSRARRIAFGGMPRAEMERTLRNRWDVEPERAAELARISGGRLGWAVLALHDERLTAGRDAALDDAQAVAAAPLSERFARAAELGGRYSRDRTNVQSTLGWWQEWWRDVLLIAAGRDALAVNRDRLDSLSALAAQCPVRSAVRALRAIAEARQQLQENASPTLTLEAMMLALPELRHNAVTGRLVRTASRAAAEDET